MDMSVAEIAKKLSASFVGDPDVRVTGLNGIKDALKGELTFVENALYLPYLQTTEASAILVPSDCSEAPKPIIQVANPKASFAQLLALRETETLAHPRGIHPTAVVGKDVVLGKNVTLDAHVTLADKCRIGDNVVLYAGVYVGRGSSIGDDTIIFPNATIRENIQIGRRCIIHNNASIGCDGFGFVKVGGKQQKIPQVGGVIVGDDVEIGANSCIDRATCGNTIVGDGTKLDNLVQIGHNSIIGEHCAFSSGTAIAGSAVVGNRVVTGGQAGIGGHLEVGDDVTVAARGGIIRSVEANRSVSGFPAVDHSLMKKVYVSRLKLPQTQRRVKQLEVRVAELEKLLDGQTTDHG